MQASDCTLAARRSHRRRWAVAGIAGAAFMVAPASGALAAPGDAGREPPSTTITQSVAGVPTGTSISEIVREAKPLKIKTLKGLGPAHQAQRAAGAPDRPDGPQVKVPGALGTSAAAPDAGSASAALGAQSAVAQNGPWPYSYSTNPNRQVGKLYFDVDPDPNRQRWSWCSATAVNSENKSLVLTAGHCVFSPDPDGNGRITGNGYWHQHVQFCPGYENGCKLGVYGARFLTTTPSWFYGSGGNYEWGDDTAIALVNPNSNGYLVNYTGGQGITWNAPANQTRWAFGYPGSDSRWPEYSYSGEDLIYCGGSSWAVTANHYAMRCTMTGGSSGGAHLSYVNSSNWIGYANGVNSHKPWGGAYMGSPYFGGAEGNLYNYARAR